MDEKKLVSGLRIDKTQYSEQVFDYIFKEIANKRLKSGDKLPNERRLSEELEISRPPLREALKALSAIGLLKTTPGGGSYVNDYGKEYIHTILKFLSVCDEKLMLDFFQLRKALETEATRMAAQNMTEKQLERLKSIHEKRKNLYDSNLDDIETIRPILQNLDFDFHNQIIKASGNDIFSEFLEAIRETLRLQQKFASKDFSISGSSMEYHERLIDAFSRKDPDGAAKIMHKHLSEVEMAMADNLK